MAQRMLKVFTSLMLFIAGVFTVTAKKVSYWFGLEAKESKPAERPNLPTLEVLNSFILDCHLKEVLSEHIHLYEEEGLVDFSCVGDAIDRLPGSAEVLASNIPIACEFSCIQ